MPLFLVFLQTFLLVGNTKRDSITLKNENKEESGSVTCHSSCRRVGVYLPGYLAEKGVRF